MMGQLMLVDRIPAGRECEPALCLYKGGLFSVGRKIHADDCHSNRVAGEVSQWPWLVWRTEEIPVWFFRDESMGNSGWANYDETLDEWDWAWDIEDSSEPWPDEEEYIPSGVVEDADEQPESNEPVATYRITMVWGNDGSLLIIGRTGLVLGGVEIPAAFVRDFMDRVRNFSLRPDAETDYGPFGPSNCGLMMGVANRVLTIGDEKCEAGFQFTVDSLQGFLEMLVEGLPDEPEAGRP